MDAAAIQFLPMFSSLEMLTSIGSTMSSFETAEGHAVVLRQYEDFLCESDLPAALSLGQTYEKILLHHLHPGSSHSRLVRVLFLRRRTERLRAAGVDVHAACAVSESILARNHRLCCRGKPCRS